MRILVASIAVLFVLTVSSTAWACDCVTRSPDESFRDADVVFEGQVIRITPTSSGLAYTFYARKVLKGLPVREFTLEQAHTDCDATFGPDITYRVYARRSEGKLFSSACAGNEAVGFIRRINTFDASVKSSLMPIVLWIVGVGLTATGFWFWDRRKRDHSSSR